MRARNEEVAEFKKHLAALEAKFREIDKLKTKDPVDLK